MVLSVDDVKQLAEQARIGLDLGDAEDFLEKFTSDLEAETLRKELSEILQLLDEILGVDTAAIDPMNYPRDLRPHSSKG